jgi:hypothetical protein
MFQVRRAPGTTYDALAFAEVILFSDDDPLLEALEAFDRTKYGGDRPQEEDPRPRSPQVCSEKKLKKN